MFKKTIEYEDFSGQKQSRDFYFHMSKAEFLEMAANGNAMMERIQRIISAKDGQAILKEVRELIWHSIGIRSEDGQRFIKDSAAKAQLFESPAYDELLMELSTNAEASAEFFKQLVPEKMQKEMQAQLQQAGQQPGVIDVRDPFKQPAQDDPRPDWMKEERNPTQRELQNMNAEELRLAFQFRKPAAE